MEASQRKFISTEALVLGLIIGGLLMAVDIVYALNGQHVVEGAIQETFWVVVYLTVLVAFAGFKLPTFFAESKPRLAVFTLVFMAGHVSLFFDSFAVVMLLNGLTFMPWKGVTRYSFKFNVFAVKVMASVCALTVGGGFYLGELWGLPHFISSGMDNPIAGFPLLIVATPFCIAVAAVTAFLFPVRMEKVEFDAKQWKATGVIVFFLLALIFTHMPLACMGALLLFGAGTGRILTLIKSTLHELEEGALNAVCLILAALLIKLLPGANEWFAEQLTGGWVLLGAAISSPFTGAMAPPSTDLHTFYVTLSYIMLGAPLLVSSSLVAIVVFKDSIDYEDLPVWLKPLASKKKGVMQEALAYTVMCVPLVVVLGAGLWLGNATGIFVSVYEFLSAATGIG